MNKIKIIVITAVFLTLLFLNFYFTDKKDFFCKDCNVVLISLDTVRADRMGLYGNKNNTTPFLDKLADKSTVFYNAFSQDSFTPTSHMSIFSGLYPKTHNIWEDKKIDSSIKTLASILKEKGYKTAWNATANDRYLDPDMGLGRGFGIFLDKDYFSSGWKEGINWIKQNKKDRFFIFLHSYHAHDPYFPSEENLKFFLSDEDIEIFEKLKNEILKLTLDQISSSFNISLSGVNINNEFINSKLKEICGNKPNPIACYQECSSIYTGNYWGVLNKNKKSNRDFLLPIYDATIKDLDDDIKEVFKALEKENLKKKTIVIITSDHGEEFFEHGKIGHGSTLYDEVIHVPLIIWNPNYQKRKIYSLTQSIDILPTVLDIIDADIPGEVEGISMANLIQGENQTENKYVFGQTRSNIYSIRAVEQKYITDFSEVNEFYNLKNDFNENKNLIFETDYNNLKTELEIFANKKNNINQNDSLKISSKELENFSLLNKQLDIEKNVIYTYDNNEKKLNIEKKNNISESEANNFIKDELIKIESAFSSSPSPYPGRITNEIICDKDKLLQIKTNENNLRYITTYSNSRFGVGVCNEDEIEYHYLIGWIHCSNNQELYTIRYFLPIKENREELENFYNNLECIN